MHAASIRNHREHEWTLARVDEPQLPRVGGASPLWNPPVGVWWMAGLSELLGLMGLKEAHWSETSSFYFFLMEFAQIQI